MADLNTLVNVTFPALFSYSGCKTSRKKLGKVQVSGLIVHTHAMALKKLLNFF